MDYPLSNIDISAYLKGAKIVPYSNIRKYPDINTLLEPYGCIVILYRAPSGVGHWCCLIKNKHGYEFFDPYGVLLDEQLEYTGDMKGQMAELFKQDVNQDHRYLTMLLAKTNLPVSYNHHKFQTFKRPDGIIPSTCGRHCILRILNKDLSLSEYKDQFDDTVNNVKIGAGDDKYNYDNAVTCLVNSANWG